MTGKDKGNLDRILEGNAEPKKKVRRRVKKQPEGKGLLAAKKAKTVKEKKPQSAQNRVLTVDDIGPSKFRQKSADWMSDMEESVHEELKVQRDGFDFHKWMKSLTPVQWAAGFMAIVLFITSITGTVAYANYQGEQKLTEAFATLEEYEAIAAASSEITSAELETVEIPLAMEEAPEQDEAAVKTLSLVLTSVEKDLKIKVVDGEDTLVKGVEWKVNVTDSKDKTTELVDDDKDGVIHATDLAAGDYAVALVPDDFVTEYTFPTEPMTVAVKAKVEYKVIQDIKDEIKKESEINVAAEDTGGQQAADVEQAAKLTDTVEWVESTKTPKGTSVDGYVESAVYLDYTAKIQNKLSEILASAFDSLRVSSTAILSKDHILSLPMGFLVADTTPSEPASPPTSTTEQTPSSSSTEQSTSSSSSTETPPPASTMETPASTTEIPPSTSTTETPPATSSTNTTSTTVVTPPTVEASIQISGPVVVKPGTSTTLKATVVPSTDGVSWSSADNSIATVSSAGIVTGVKAGTVSVTATSSSGKTASVTITVAAVETASIAISGTSTVKVGATTTLKATVTPTTDTVTWSSATTSVATINSSGVVTGVKAGTSVITAKSSSGKTANITITVEGAKYADSAQLYDQAKNKLYVLDGANYRLATYGDYKSGKFSKYYKKAAVDEYLYTGWQTIDGLTYYFKKDNTKVTGEQIIGGVKYNFASDGALSQGSGTLGIDVSKYQPNINWASVKASGISYVIIRCGYRGASTGALIEDPYFRSHIKGAKAAGLKVGVYFFTTAVTEAEAVEEASMCAALCSGYGLNYPVFMDCESSGRPGYMNLSAGQRTSIIKAFCSTIRSAGYTPGVYANKTWLTSYMNASELSGYKIWLAQYNTQVTYRGRYDLWQFTSKGSVNGIPGNVDMNQSYMGY